MTFFLALLAIPAGAVVGVALAWLSSALLALFVKPKLRKITMYHGGKMVVIEPVVANDAEASGTNDDH